MESKAVVFFFVAHLDAWLKQNLFRVKYFWFYHGIKVYILRWVWHAWVHMYHLSSRCLSCTCWLKCHLSQKWHLKIFVPWRRYPHGSTECMRCHQHRGVGRWSRRRTVVATDSSPEDAWAAYNRCTEHMDIEILRELVPLIEQTKSTRNSGELDKLSASVARIPKSSEIPKVANTEFPEGIMSQ